MNNEFAGFCKEVITQRLPGLIDQYFYGNELPAEVVAHFEWAGNITDTRKESQAMAIKWFDEISLFLDVERKIHGEPRFSVLKQTGQFLVSMVSYGVTSILSQSMLVYCNWDIEFRLSEKAIDAILRQIKNKNVRFRH